jgi:aspartate/methionine/tyrosine aminotransferase
MPDDLARADAAPRLSSTIARTDAPPIPAARAWAGRYRGEAGPAIDLTQAVPGYPPHPDLLARLAAAAGDVASAGYGPILGDPGLREALAADIAARYRAPVGVDDVAITAGCNLAFAMAMEAVAAPGEAVMLPSPWYFNHQMALAMRGVAAVPLPCRAEDGFIPDVQRAAAALTPAVRAIVLVTPNNPTGAVYPPATIAAFAALARTRGLWLVIDETYRDFLPGDAPPHALFADAAWRQGVVHLYSFSKAYCVPGHRVGAVAAGPGFLEGFAKAADTLQICAPRPPQAALAWGIVGLRAWREGNRRLMARRAEAFRAAMSAARAWRIDALGGYFAYLRVPDDLPGAVAVAERLAGERGLLVLPGPFFGPGQERHLRVAFANADEATIAAVPARLSALA